MHIKKIYFNIYTLFLLIVVIGNTGIWYMPNIEGQYIMSQHLTKIPFGDPNQHYMMTNYLQPFLFGIFGGNSLTQYLLFTFLTTISFLILFINWFIRTYSQMYETIFYKLLALITFSIFMVPFYWIGMDGMTLLLMLLIMINYHDIKKSLFFAVLLGTQHSEQGLAGFLLLLGSLTIFTIVSKKRVEWKVIENPIYIILGIIFGKLMLLIWFSVAGIDLLTNRHIFLKQHLDIFINQWLAGWPFILYSMFGIGWILILRYLKYTYPLVLASLIAFIFVMVAGDQTRVSAIILFPSLFYWVFMNKPLINAITIKTSILVLSMYLLLPVVFVWEGYAFGSLLKYDLGVIQKTYKHQPCNIDIMEPFRQVETSLVKEPCSQDTNNSQDN